MSDIISLQNVLPDGKQLELPACMDFAVVLKLKDWQIFKMYRNLKAWA